MKLERMVQDSHPDRRVQQLLGLIGRVAKLQTQVDNLATQLENDPAPKLAGNLEINKKKLHFPSVRNIDDALDEDDMASDSATAFATQQSIKAYIASTIAGSITNLDGGSAPTVYGGVGDSPIDGGTA